MASNGSSFWTFLQMGIMIVIPYALIALGVVAVVLLIRWLIKHK